MPVHHPDDAIRDKNGDENRALYWVHSGGNDLEQEECVKGGLKLQYQVVVWVLNLDISTVLCRLNIVLWRIDK